MTPEVNQALLSAKGEVFPGLVGYGVIDEEAGKTRFEKLQATRKINQQKKLEHLLKVVPKTKEFVQTDIDCCMSKSSLAEYLTKAVKLGYLTREKRKHNRAQAYFYRWAS
jgi:hypothetical protein